MERVPRKSKKVLKAEGEKYAEAKGIANAKVTAIKRGFKIEVNGQLVYRQEQKFNYYK